MGPPDSRDRILRRVAAAVERGPQADHPGRLRAPAIGDLRAAFSSRFAANGGETVSPDPRHSVQEWLGKLLGELDVRAQGVAVAPDMPAALRPVAPSSFDPPRSTPPSPDTVADPVPVGPSASPAAAGVGLCLARAAVAETGSLILASPSRATQVLPPVLVVWVPAGCLRGRLEEALVDLKGDLPAAVGVHSGPSKSADIGQTVVTGVHGPGRCVAVLE